MPSDTSDPWGPVGAEVLRWLPTTTPPQPDPTVAIAVIGLLFALAVLIAGFRLRRTLYPLSEQDSDEAPDAREEGRG